MRELRHHAFQYGVGLTATLVAGPERLDARPHWGLVPEAPRLLLAGSVSPAWRRWPCLRAQAQAVGLSARAMSGAALGMALRALERRTADPIGALARRTTR
jgi:hypothetical protein